MIVSKEQLSTVAVEAGKKRGRVRASYIRNSSPVPNWYFDCFLQDTDIPAYVHTVFLFLLRRTIGWDKKTELVSYDQLENGTGRCRDSIAHSILLLTDCWGLFSFEPGRGKRKSKFTVLGDWDKDAVLDRKMLLNEAYKSDCPSYEELRLKPCTPEVLAACKVKQDETRRKFQEKANSKQAA